MTIVQGYGDENRVIAVHGAHRFLGELSLLIGQRLYLTGVVREAGEVIEVPLRRVWELVAEDKAISDMILGAFMARRAILVDLGAGIKLIGSRFSPDSRRLREFLARNRMPYEWIDLETDDAAEGLLRRLGIPAGETPVVIASGGEILRNPSTAELGAGARARLAYRAAGALRCGRRRRGTRPVSRQRCTPPRKGSTSRAWRLWRPEVRPARRAGSRTIWAFPAGISGNELTERAFVQAGKFGARLTTPAEAVSLRSEPGHHAIELSNGTTATGRTVVIATGAQYRRLDVASARRLRGRRRLLRRNSGRGSALPRRTGGHRRRRQLRRPGGDVPLRGLALPAADPRW